MDDARVTRSGPARPVAPPGEPGWPETETVFAVLSGAERKGAWEPPEALRVVSILGGARLDFREADLLEGVTEIEIFTVMGGVEITVPPDVDVDARGLGVMGGFAHVRHRAAETDAPCLRIRGFALMGGVEIKLRTTP
jgi:hypothetical protein